MKIGFYITLISLTLTQALALAGNIPAIGNNNPCVDDYFQGTYMISQSKGIKRPIPFPAKNYFPEHKMIAPKGKIRLENINCYEIQLGQENQETFVFDLTFPPAYYLKRTIR